MLFMLSSHSLARLRSIFLHSRVETSCISTFAEFKSYDKSYESPFSVEAKKNGKEEPGGKEDDISVIVS